MSDIILNCPFCQNKLKKYATNSEVSNFFCEEPSCIHFDRIKLSSCILVVGSDMKAVFYYRLAFKHKIIEGSYFNNSTVLKCPDNRTYDFKVIATMNYYPLSITSNWLQELETIYKKLELYSVFT